MKKSIFGLITSFGLMACGGGGGDTIDPPPPPPPPKPTVTLEFDLTDFTEVAFRNSFEFIVQEGDQFAIEVTIDEEYADLVDVAKDGNRLSIGFREDFTGDIRAETAEGIVTLPTLTAVEVANSAIVTAAGFTGSFLEVDLSGSSILEGPNNNFDFVDATLTGSSVLQLEDIAPVPAANAELSGSSHAVINMMAGGTLTGSASGDSNLSYYGDNVSVQVQTFNTASVTRLGSTRQ